MLSIQEEVSVSVWLTKINALNLNNLKSALLKTGMIWIVILTVLGSNAIAEPCDTENFELPEHEVFLN